MNNDIITSSKRSIIQSNESENCNGLNGKEYEKSMTAWDEKGNEEINNTLNKSSLKHRDINSGDIFKIEKDNVYKNDISENKEENSNLKQKENLFNDLNVNHVNCENKIDIIRNVSGDNDSTMFSENSFKNQLEINKNSLLHSESINSCQNNNFTVIKTKTSSLKYKETDDKITLRNQNIMIDDKSKNECLSEKDIKENIVISDVNTTTNTLLDENLKQDNSSVLKDSTVEIENDVKQKSTGIKNQSEININLFDDKNKIKNISENKNSVSDTISDFVMIKSETQKDNMNHTESNKKQNEKNENQASEYDSVKIVQSTIVIKNNDNSIENKVLNNNKNSNYINLNTPNSNSNNKITTNTNFAQKANIMNKNSINTCANNINRSTSNVNNVSSNVQNNANTLPQDIMTIFARNLHDIGLELVRQQVYKDLIDIQLTKEAQNKLNEREKEQLVKLEEFHAKQKIRNEPFDTGVLLTCRCKSFLTESVNVMRLHQEYGYIDSCVFHVCCCCEDFKSRWPSHFIGHMRQEHDFQGRIRKKTAPFKCYYCSFEAKNLNKIESHMVACSKRFVLSCNLHPLPADTDIPIKKRSLPMQQANSYYSRYFQQNQVAGTSVPNNSIMNKTINSIQQTARYMDSSLRQNLPSNAYKGTNSGNNTYPQTLGALKPTNTTNNSHGIIGSNKPGAVPNVKDTNQSSVQRTVEVCEICSYIVYSRAALLNHLQLVHKVKLNASRLGGLGEPNMSCDRCSQKFWTYQGLVKHAMAIHKLTVGNNLNSTNNSNNRAATTNNPSGGNVNFPSSGAGGRASLCHLCGESQTLNPLNHLSSRHNITLLDMYQVRQCCICNRTMRTGPAFQEHMTTCHKDIFANKDVLHTVLQALSAARHLKKEENINQNQSNQIEQKYTPEQKAKLLSLYQQNKQKKFPASSIGTNHISNNIPSLGNTEGINKSSVKKRQIVTSPDQVSNSEANTLPIVEKKSAEQDKKELEKLYENLASIGRPILRSMRNKTAVNNADKIGSNSKGKKIGDDALLKKKSEKETFSENSNNEINNTDKSFENIVELKNLNSGDDSSNVEDEVIESTKNKSNESFIPNENTNKNKNANSMQVVVKATTENIERAQDSTDSIQQPDPKKPRLENIQTMSSFITSDP